MATQQSPVDITGLTEGCSPKLELAYEGTADHIANTGDFVRVRYEDGGSIVLDGRAYPLVEAHPHNPSEHTIEGVRFALEMHLVHVRDSGEHAVIGILYRLGAANAAIQKLIDYAPAQGEEDRTPLSNLVANEFLPSPTGYFAYMGSLTTPPYTEGVQWLVLSEISEVSEEQVSRIAALTGGGTNSRALQTLHGRKITACGLP